MRIFIGTFFLSTLFNFIFHNGGVIHLIYPYFVCYQQGTINFSQVWMDVITTQNMPYHNFNNAWMKVFGSIPKYMTHAYKVFWINMPMSLRKKKMEKICGKVNNCSEGNLDFILNICLQLFGLHIFEWDILEPQYMKKKCVQ